MVHACGFFWGVGRGLKKQDNARTDGQEEKEPSNQLEEMNGFHCMNSILYSLLYRN